jgi:small-conductance mechanosensitive channel
MSGETEKSVSGWTVDTLKELMEQRFIDSDKAVQAALLAAKEAVLKAEVATEKRFESVNEFRGQLADQTSNLMPRAEYNAKHQALEDKLVAITDRINKSEGATQGSDLTINKIYGAIAAAVAVISILVLLANKVFN